MKAILAAALLLGLLFAGCSSSGPSGPTFVTPDKDAQGRYVVELVEQKFVPANIQVPRNSTVVWVYVSGGAHDVTAEDGSFGSDAELKKKLTANDKEYTHVFTTAGETAYHCQLHAAQNMSGKVKVV